MEIQAREVGDHIMVLRVDGRLNMVSAASLKSAIDDAVNAGKSRVVVDLSAVSFMDSSGLGALIGGLKKTRQASGDLRIAGVAQQVATVLRLTNLDRVLRPYADVEAALGGW